MIKATFLAVLITLSADPIFVNSCQAVPKTVSIGTIISGAYSIRIETIPGYVGEEGMAKVIFIPTENYKWNKDYPSVLKIIPIENEVAHPVRKKLNREEFKPIGDDVILCVSYKAKKEGRIKFKALVNFSVCNEKECLTFRNEKLTLSFIVVGK